MRVIKKTIRLLGYGIEALKYFVLVPIAKLCYRKRDIRLFAERGTDARDNGLYIYRFYRQNHPELESYYVITKNSADRYKVEELGNVVKYRSLKHYLLFIAAKYKISTHVMGCSPNVDFYSRIANKIHLKIKGKKVFLQHGVIKETLPQLYSKETKLDLFICGAKPEFDFISKTFGYENDEVKYTGLARFDGLHDVELKRQILCMPTWRMYLKDSSIDFAKSEYVIKWNSFINNEILKATLRENNIKLIFYPHYELQDRIDLFKSNSDEVVIAKFKDYDVQQLLKESQLLITDFSSVYFDFAYMKKPMVFYQFDRERYDKGHYAKGYFDYETMGFGEVVQKEEDLVDIIIAYINRQFKMTEYYESRTNDFFPLHDNQNCQRIFNEIEGLNEK